MKGWDYLETISGTKSGIQIVFFCYFGNKPDQSELSILRDFRKEQNVGFYSVNFLSKIEKNLTGFLTKFSRLLKYPYREILYCISYKKRVLFWTIFLLKKLNLILKNVNFFFSFNKWTGIKNEMQQCSYESLSQRTTSG